MFLALQALAVAMGVDYHTQYVAYLLALIVLILVTKNYYHDSPFHQLTG